MPIHRSGPTPEFYKYICEYALVPNGTAPSPQLLALMPPGVRLNWLEIPRFQRGISWDLDNVREFFQSTSLLLGNIILALFDRDPASFPNLPPTQTEYIVLVDGLQRFAVGTAVLAALHNRVLVPTPTRPGDSGYFAALSARVLSNSPYYLHNHSELLNHPRQAIRDQYNNLMSTVDQYIEEELVGGRGNALATMIIPTFLTRQVAIDLYSNFRRTELLNTFIGINTVRVDLGPVDLLRAYIIEKATPTWPEIDIETFENDFTDVFVADQKPKQHFLPFVNACLKCIDSGGGSRLFPSWNTTLLQVDVDNFLSFMTNFETSTSNSYLREIFECGKLPVSIVLAHYYKEYLHGTHTCPSFFTGGVLENSDLHSFIICCYRQLLNGSIGRTSNYLEQVVDGRINVTLPVLSDSISVDYIGVNINSPLDPLWLESVLNQIDKKRASRVFNAMLLPNKSTRGTVFNPLSFGRSSLNFHIDHLIPASLLNTVAPGGAEGNLLRNFAPLPTNQNRVAKATSCSSKLGAGGIYSTYLSGTTHQVHPYCNWLVNAHSIAYSAIELDNQAKLERLATPDIGTTRIQKIRDELLVRL